MKTHNRSQAESHSLLDYAEGDPHCRLAVGDKHIQSGLEYLVNSTQHFHLTCVTLEESEGVREFPVMLERKRSREVAKKTKIPISSFLPAVGR